MESVIFRYRGRELKAEDISFIQGAGNLREGLIGRPRRRFMGQA
jgi:hypothetical protein